MSTELQLVVFRLTTIGVLLSSAAPARGSSISATAIRTTSPRATRTTCVQCGLFNYLTIYLFKFFIFGGAVSLVFFTEYLPTNTHVVKTSNTYIEGWDGSAYPGLSVFGPARFML